MAVMARLRGAYSAFFSPSKGWTQCPSVLVLRGTLLLSRAIQEILSCPPRISHVRLCAAMAWWEFALSHFMLPGIHEIHQSTG